MIDKKANISKKNIIGKNYERTPNGFYEIVD